MAEYKFYIEYDVADEDGRGNLSSLVFVNLPTQYEAILFARALQSSPSVKEVYERNGLDFSYAGRYPQP